MDSVDNRFCFICNIEITGDYCHNCGQKITGKKTSSTDILKALLSGLFSMERGIIGVIHELTIKPGKVIENYWRGNRFYYYSPGQMIFYTIFVLGLHMAFICKEYILGIYIIADNSGGLSTILTPQLFLIVLILPLYAITTFLSFFKKGKTFPEHFISATYIFSYGAILGTIICDILYLVFDFPLIYTMSFLLFFLFIWGSRIFVTKNKWYNYIFGVLIQVAVFLLLVLLLAGIFYLYTGGKGFEKI